MMSILYIFDYVLLVNTDRSRTDYKYGIAPFQLTVAPSHLEIYSIIPTLDILGTVLGLNSAAQWILLQLLKVLNIVDHVNLVTACIHHEDCVLCIFRRNETAVVEQVESEIGTWSELQNKDLLTCKALILKTFKEEVSLKWQNF